MTTDTNPRTYSRGPIGTVKASTPLLVGIVLLAGAPVAYVAAASPGAFSPAHQETDQVSLQGPVQSVVIHGMNGSVHVKNDKSVSGVNGSAVLTWNIAAEKPQLVEKVADGVATLDFADGASGGVGWDVAVPPGVAVKVDTTNAAAYVTGVTGTVDVHTTNGKIVATGLGDGNVTLTTSNDNVNASFAGAPTSIKAKTANGNIEIRTDGRTPYFDDAGTTNGHTDLTNPGARDYKLADTRMIEANSTNGNITIS